MICVKYQYMSPLYGMVTCEDISSDYDYYELDPKTMLTLYNRSNEVMDFVDNLEEDLVEYIHKELKEVVVKAVFGSTCMRDCKLYLRTEIYATRYLTPEEQDLLQRWITGQMSDGWGESLEQKEVTSETVEVNRPQFDSDQALFVNDYETVKARYYLNPWSSTDWKLELVDMEYEELELEAQSKETEIAQLKDEVKELVSKLREYTTKLTEIAEKVNEL